jgi:hypothetical protein
VQTLDIQEWNVKPSHGLVNDDSDYDVELDEDMDEDYRAQMARGLKARAQGRAQNNLEWEDLQRQEALEEEDYEQYIPLFQKAVRELPIEQTSTDRFCQCINSQDKDCLIALLITRLPHLKTLYMTIPEGE